ncbi:MAG: MBL fold metallo-hydrolase [Dethiobacteria bacterium]|jgi:L-ascorbate metabolism protein UlaG (beta-lactamase superfamily)
MQNMKRIFIFLLLTLLLAGIAMGGCTAAPENTGEIENGAESGGDQAGTAEGTADQEEPVEPAGEEDPETPLTLTYLGHSTFWVEYGDTAILIDPYQPDFGSYGKIDRNADVVLVTHDHTDHNYTPGGGQGATVLRGLTAAGDWQKTDYSLGELQITSVAGTFHGGNLGKNGVFVLTTPTLRLAHLGDIGHTLQAEEVAQIGNPDVLFIPVGGHYTVALPQVQELIAQLSPAVVVPIHYQTEHNPDTPIGTLDEFLVQDIPYPIEPQHSTLKLTSKKMPAQTEIWPMEYTLP